MLYPSVCRRASTWERCGAACPLLDVVLEPDRAGGKACDWRGEVVADGVAASCPLRDAQQGGDFSESGEPEFHGKTVRAGPDRLPLTATVRPIK